jgi:hypothetical protein
MRFGPVVPTCRTQLTSDNVNIVLRSVEAGLGLDIAIDD